MTQGGIHLGQQGAEEWSLPQLWMRDGERFAVVNPQRAISPEQEDVGVGPAGAPPVRLTPAAAVLSRAAELQPRRG